MRDIRAIIYACLLPLSLVAQTAAPEQVTDWIKSNAIRLSTVEAGHGFDDMQPLKKVVGDARIVSLGEATHGSREFFQLKHRMLEFLATQMGFTIFSIEANMPEAYRLNDYVLNGTGDPMKLIKGMYFWTWDTEEVLDMVRWMREFNKSGKGRVEFTGFDMQTPNVANQIVRDFVSRADPDYTATLAHASSDALAPSLRPQQDFGTATGSFPVAAAAGKVMRISGYIKTQDVQNYAGFWLRADIDRKPAGFINLKDAAPTKTTDWQRYTMELAIPKETTAIYFGALLAGAGTAWFDDLEIELDGQRYEDPNFDFKFEGSTLKGLSQSTFPFPSQLDAKVAHTGAQSLRMSHTEAPKNANAVDPKIASAEWKNVVDYLTQSKERYAKQGLATKEIDWATQNARVVWQCMEMRANEVSRDASMAANVKWILDQSPKAKIMLWAHNGHVGNMYDGSMGSALRNIYGNQMVVFGFAFNQGSFQAIPQGGGSLKNFTVPPAPAGSLDSTLAASGLPLFALDVRALPKDGPVADWLSKGRGTRSIGAIYPENSPYAFVTDQVIAKAFDVVLFVEKTTAARKNPGGPSGPSGVDYKSTRNRNGQTEYSDPEFNISLSLPDSLKVTQASRWGDHETTVTFFDAQKNAIGGSLYFKTGVMAKATEEQVYQDLLLKPAAKTAQRAEFSPDYRVRPETVQRKHVNGMPAVACVADFTHDGQKMAEYLMWIQGKSTTALLFAAVPQLDLAAAQVRLDTIAETVKLP